MIFLFSQLAKIKWTATNIFSIILLSHIFSQVSAFSFWEAAPPKPHVYGRSIAPAHMRLHPYSLLVARQNSSSSSAGGRLPLIITNNCSGSVWPGINTQHGSPPDTNGFELKAGENRTVTVSRDWQGRIWGRTNCTFEDGSNSRKACGTGDCAGDLNCKIAGEPPVTLAEFTMLGNADTCFYDISLVDGFNIGMAIRLISNGVAKLQKVLASRSNPSCVASVANLNEDFDAYPNDQVQFLGSNKSDPLPFVSGITRQMVSQWCPWDLQVSPPQKPYDGVYAYPDDNLQREVFQPCYSACAKNNKPEDCCTGAFNSPNKCKASDYSTKAKKICPDAYTFAYDDQDSTFTTAAGAGFEIIMCPGGLSTKILKNSTGDTLAGSKQMTSSANSQAESMMPDMSTLTFAALGFTAAFFWSR